MLAGYLFLRFKDGREICQINPSQTLMNLQYMYFQERQEQSNASCLPSGWQLTCRVCTGMGNCTDTHQLNLVDDLPLLLVQDYMLI